MIEAIVQLKDRLHVDWYMFVPAFLISLAGLVTMNSFSGENHQKLYSEYGRDGNIDSIGSGYESEHNPVKEFLGKLIKVKDKMLTKEGKKIAEERHKFMIEFFDRLNKEIEGEL